MHTWLWNMPFLLIWTQRANAHLVWKYAFVILIQGANAHLSDTHKFWSRKRMHTWESHAQMQWIMHFAPVKNASIGFANASIWFAKSSRHIWWHIIAGSLLKNQDQHFQNLDLFWTHWLTNSRIKSPVKSGLFFRPNIKVHGNWHNYILFSIISS